jgi:aldose 1-epimerase
MSAYQKPVSPIHSELKDEDFRTVVDGKPTHLYFLQNKNDLELAVTDFGARVIEIWTPDRNGLFDDIVLGHSNINAYVSYQGERFLGASIGRYGNRIANGRFSLNGKTYQLPINNEPNSLHGGTKGFDMVVWDAVQEDSRTIHFQYTSADGEQGYPGTLKVEMTYQLTDNNEFIITYQAKTDQTTVINLTHHSFFNLHGAGNDTINDHIMTINADHFTPINDVMIPTGEIASVNGTPMDFRTPTAIGACVDDDFIQLHYGHGYDHNWVLNRTTENEVEHAASVYEPESGRLLEVYTTEPGMQFYGGNFFDGSIIGKKGKHYDYRASFALETQHFPDSPNHSNFPSVVLSPEETYHQTCLYRFKAK